MALGIEFVVLMRFVLYNRSEEVVTLGGAERQASREAARRSSGGQALRVVCVVGPEERGEQVVARPVEQAVIASRKLFGAAFHAADPRLTSAVVAWHPYRGEQRDDLPRCEPFGEPLTNKRRAIIALEHQRWTVLCDESLQYRQRLDCRGVGHRRPRQLQPTGQVADRQDLIITAIDWPRRLAVIDRPHGPRTTPVERFHDERMRSLEALTVILHEVFQDATGNIRATRLESRHAEAWSRLVEDRLDYDPLFHQGLPTGTPTQPRHQFAA